MFAKIKQVVQLIIVMILIATTLLSPQAAYAGSNGQQIYFSCKTYVQGVPVMNAAVIKGYNQSGQYVMWQGGARWEGNNWSTYVFAQGWWWIGKVRIYWWNANSNSWKSAEYTIPKQLSGSNTVYLQCPTYY